MFFLSKMIDEEEELVGDYNGDMMEDGDASEQRDLGYLHVTVPRIESIFEKNRKVCLK